MDPSDTYPVLLQRRVHQSGYNYRVGHKHAELPCSSAELKPTAQRLCDFTLADRAHPNAEGHKLIAEALWPYFEPMLAK